MSFTQVKYWLFLLLAIVFEVGGTSIMKLSQSPHWFLGPTAGLGIMFALIGLSYYCLALSVQGLPVGVAFASWEGLGLTLITLVSVFLLGEPFTLIRLGALCAVLVGVMLIHHGTTDSEENPQADSQNPGGVSSSAATPETTSGDLQ